MRVVLFGGLSTLLIGLVAFGAVLIADRRTKPVAPVDDEPDNFEPPPRRTSSRDQLPARRLSSVSPAACAPKPGRACWRGRLRLTDAVRKAWSEAREAARARGEGTDGDGEADDADADAAPGFKVHVNEATGAVVVTEEGADSDTNAPGSGKGGDDSVAALPPEGSFADYFSVRAALRDDPPGAAAAGTIQAGDVDADDAPNVANLAPDGTFDLDVAPGRYDVEVTSKDALLIGGIDALDARAGDAQDGLELVPARPVTISGRVLDDDNVAIDASVELRRLHRNEGLGMQHQDQGRFAFGGLRPGAYLLTVNSEAGRSEAFEVRAPLDGITLRVTRLPSALVLVGAANDGQCPTGNLVLTSVGLPRHHRSVYVRGCQGLIRNVRPGTTFRAVGKLGGKPFDRVISFGFGKPIAPVCLEGGCRPDVAAVEVRVVDADGIRVPSADIEVVAGPPEGPAPGAFLDPFTSGLRAGASLTLRARTMSLEATTTVWLAAGTNSVVMRFPGRFTERD